MKLQSLAISALVALPLAASALPLAGLGYATYGNVNSYSLPLSALQFDPAKPGPGNPYYVPSGPGQIQDQVVIYTGANGTGVTTNAAGFDNAYGAPNGTKAFASISGSVNMENPGNKAGINNNDANSWDASLLALKGFLDGGNPLFLFNNNDTNEDQNLAIWAKIWITDAGNSVYNNRWLYLSNNGQAYGATPIFNGDATIYNPTTPSNITNPLAGYAATDYVLSGGSVNGVNHNLGANQAAYAGDVPLLNQWLADLFTLDDSTLTNYTMHMDLKLGCTSKTAWALTGQDDKGKVTDLSCQNVAIDNGYEQLFLVSSKFVPPEVVPEPGSIALVGAALAGLALVRRRRNNAVNAVA